MKVENAHSAASKMYPSRDTTNHKNNEHNRLQDIRYSAFIDGAQWQSQHTAKEIEALQDRVTELEMQLSGIETKHQEELSNYNSYAAAHVEEQFENKIEELAEWLERDKQVAIGMMGELANPAVVVYNTCISRLKAISID